MKRLLVLIVAVFLLNGTFLPTGSVNAADLISAAKSGQGNAAILKPIPVHGDIASRVSTTRETVARVLNDLARQGIVERTKDALVVHDISQLEHLVEESQGEQPSRDASAASG